jgi:hypothetical protein
VALAGLIACETNPVDLPVEGRRQDLAGAVVKRPLKLSLSVSAQTDSTVTFTATWKRHSQNPSPDYVFDWRTTTSGLAGRVDAETVDFTETKLADAFVSQFCVLTVRVSDEAKSGERCSNDYSVEALPVPPPADPIPPDSVVVTSNDTTLPPPPPPPPPPSGVHPNEPGGFTTNATLDKGFNAQGENGWTPRDPTQQVWTTDATAPFSGPNISRMNWFAGQGAGAYGNGEETRDVPANSGEYYVHMVLKFSSGYYTPFANGHKGAGYNVAARPLSPIILPLWKAGIDPAATQPIGLTVSFQGQESSFNLSSNVPTAQGVQRGVWVHFEAHIRYNTLGQDDGFVRVWFYEDGQPPRLYMDHDRTTDWGNATPGVIVTTDPPQVNQVKYSGIQGGTGCCLAHDVTLEFDHWYSSFKP